MIKNQLFIAAALFAGAAIGYIMKPDAPAAEADDEGYVAKSQIADSGEDASIKALRARIAELEKLLAAKDGERIAETENRQPRIPDAQDGEKEKPRSPMQDMREHMEWLAKEKPGEFAQMTNAMARWRQRRIERAHSKLDFLASIDTSTMTAEQQAAHEQFQNLLVRREELEEKMANPEMTDEDREDIMRDMHATGWAMRDAAKAERETLISQTVQSLGYSGDDAADVTAAFTDILSVTETRGGPPPGVGGPGGMGAPPAGGAPGK